MEALTPQQLSQEAQTFYNQGDYRSAAPLFKAAADGFLGEGDPFSAAEMANNSSVAFLKAGDAQSAFEAAKGTDLIFAEKNDILRQAMAIGNQAAALAQLKQVGSALDAYTRSAALLEQAGEFDLRAYVMQAISELQLRSGHPLEAYATMQAGVMGINKPNLTQRLLKTLMQIPFKFLR